MTKDRQTSLMHDTAASPAAVLYSRIRWLVKLRWVYCLTFLVLAMIEYHLRAIFFPAAWVIGCAAVFYNAICWASARLCQRSESKLHDLVRLQLCIDVLGLIAILHYTGGWFNLLMPVVIFHLGVAASLLNRLEAYALAGAGTLAYFGIMCCELFWSWPLPAKHPIFGEVPTSGYNWTLRSFFSASSDDRGGHFFFVASAIIFPLLSLGVVYFTHALIARLRRINQRLVEANRRLEGLDLAKSRFLRVSAHQLRSPLAAVHTMLTAVQEAGGLNHQQYEIVRKIQARSEDAMTLVDEMMLLSTIRESAAEVRQLQPADLDAAVRSEMDAFSAEVVAKRLTVCLDASSGAEVMAWEDALETVLEHLISNAVKYTPPGGSMSIATRRTGSNVELKVSDTGIGIPPDQKDRLFHEFFRATNARQMAGGTGMGLAIVHAIVERLGGTISVDSIEDKGTTVVVTLPLSEAHSAQAPESHAQGSADQTKNSSGPSHERLEISVEGLQLKAAK